MSVWKRLTNVAKGKVKVWQQESRTYGDDVERELTELERHPAPGEEEDTGRYEASRPARRPTSDRPASPPADRPDPADDPVPRTDLFPTDTDAGGEGAQSAGTNGGTKKL